MLKELVQYLEKRPEPVFEWHGGTKYSDKELFKLSNSTPKTVRATTLKAIVDYIMQEIDDDNCFARAKRIIHIESPTEVSLISECDEDGSRWEWIASSAVVPAVPFERFMDTEMFNITLQTMFVADESRGNVLSVVGNITDGAVSGFKDDGISQTVNIKAGVQRVGTTVVPNPVVLRPYRTFPEVEQPASPFVLRMKSGSDVAPPTAALFEADGTAWRLDAVANIEAYFRANIKKELLEDGSVVIIA